MPTTAAELALVRRFPAIGHVPRAALCDLPTPVDRIPLGGERALLVKRDDLTASPPGGNKARGLEWLLGNVDAADTIVTVGPKGSNHALATAVHSGRIGARTTVIRWDQHMNAAAIAVDAATRSVARVVDARWVLAAYAIAAAHRMAARWVPAGGATPLAILGHINAGLELAEQIRAGEVETPTGVFVPLGTGGTAAGLALGFRIAGLPVPIVAVRVVPRLVGRARRVASLANDAAALLERLAGEPMPRLSPRDIAVEHRYFGGEYGRPLVGIDGALAPIAAAGIGLDDTYSAKTAFAALSSPDQRPLLWLTFDARALQFAHTHTMARH